MSFIEVRATALLLTTARRRPDGYLDDVVQHCQWVSRDLYRISEDAFRTLSEKYREHEAPPTRQSPEQLQRELEKAAHDHGKWTEQPSVEEGSSRGLGDTVAKLTKAVGIKPCDKCKKRQEKLNRLVPYR